MNEVSTAVPIIDARCTEFDALQPGFVDEWDSWANVGY